MQSNVVRDRGRGTNPNPNPNPNRMKSGTEVRGNRGMARVTVWVRVEITVRVNTQRLSVITARDRKGPET